MITSLVSNVSDIRNICIFLSLYILRQLLTGHFSKWKPSTGRFPVPELGFSDEQLCHNLRWWSRIKINVPLTNNITEIQIQSNPFESQSGNLSPDNMNVVHMQQPVHVTGILSIDDQYCYNVSNNLQVQIANSQCVNLAKLLINNPYDDVQVMAYTKGNISVSQKSKTT